MKTYAVAAPSAGVGSRYLPSSRRRPLEWREFSFPTFLFPAFLFQPHLVILGIAASKVLGQEGCFNSSFLFCFHLRLLHFTRKSCYSSLIYDACVLPRDQRRKSAHKSNRLLQINGLYIIARVREFWPRIK